MIPLVSFYPPSLSSAFSHVHASSHLPGVACPAYEDSTAAVDDSAAAVDDSGAAVDDSAAAVKRLRCCC